MLSTAQKTNPLVQKKILSEAKKGSHEAFGLIVKAYEQPVYRFVYRMVDRRQDALDVTQETFLRLYRAIGTYDSSLDFNAWLFTISRHNVYDWLRRVYRNREVYCIDGNPKEQSSSYDGCSFGLSYDGENGYFDPADTGRPVSFDSSLMTYAGYALDIESALGKLPPHYRDVLRLYYWRGFSCNEIGRRTGVSSNTVKTRLRRARHLMTCLIRRL